MSERSGDRRIVPTHLRGTQLEKAFISANVEDKLRKAQEAAAQQTDAPPYDMMQNILLKQRLRELGVPVVGTILEMETSEDYGHGEVHITDVLEGPH